MRKRQSPDVSRSLSAIQTKQPRQDPSILEAKFLQVEDELSKHSQFIEANRHRIPEFQTAAEAESELRSLLEALKQAPHPRSRGRSKEARREVSDRLTVLSRQRQELFEEENRIQKLKAVVEAAQQREDSEFSALGAEIDDAKAQLEALNVELAETRVARKRAKQSIRLVGDELASREAKLEELKTEERRLRELEKQSKREIRRLEEDQASGKQEEERILGIERDITVKEGELKRLKKILAEKRSLAKSKRDTIEQILRDADRLEYRLDEAVGHAGEVTEQQINLPSDEEVSDGPPGREEKGRPKTVIPSFLRFRRTRPEVEEEEEEEEELRSASRDSVDGKGRNSGTSPSPKSHVSDLRESSGSKEGQSRKWGSQGSFDEFVRQADSVLRSSSEESGGRDTVASQAKASVTQGKGPDIARDAMRALQIPLADTAALKAKIEAVTGNERAGAFFD
jgi:chromosome segregation ATPase